jgi:hypothetical protein
MATTHVLLTVMQWVVEHALLANVETPLVTKQSEWLAIRCVGLTTMRVGLSATHILLTLNETSRWSRRGIEMSKLGVPWWRERSTKVRNQAWTICRCYCHQESIVIIWCHRYGYMCHWWQRDGKCKKLKMAMFMFLNIGVGNDSLACNRWNGDGNDSAIDMV